VILWQTERLEECDVCVDLELTMSWCYVRSWLRPRHWWTPSTKIMIKRKNTSPVNWPTSSINYTCTWSSHLRLAIFVVFTHLQRWEDEHWVSNLTFDLAFRW